MFLSEYLHFSEKKTEQFKYKKYLKYMSSSIPDYFIIKFQDLRAFMHI